MLVHDACPNRPGDPEDKDLDKVLEQKWNNEVEIDVLNVIDNEIEDSEDHDVEHVAVVVNRDQRENVEVIGGSGSSGSCWNSHL